MSDKEIDACHGSGSIRYKQHNYGKYKRHQSKFPQTPQLQYQRPKAHVYGGHKRAGQRGLVADDKTEEANMAVQKPKESKKKHSPISLNHLLNFTVAPREDCSRNGPVIGSRARRSRTHSYNKEEFLQANCQFVVSACGEYGSHLTDPNLLVEWDKIEQVRLFSHQIPSCPICLYPPKAAKITRCGHVFCWSCVLHYLALSDKKWRKCPICYESIYMNDLRSVMALSSHQYQVGDTITLTLMKREKGTTFVLPNSQWYSDELLSMEDAAGSQFLKLVSATPEQVLSRITSVERAELLLQLKSLEESELSEEPFIELALEELKLREESLKTTKDHGKGEATMVSEHLESPCNGDQLVETCCEQEDTSVCDVDMPSKCSTPDSSKEGMSSGSRTSSSCESLDSVKRSPEHLNGKFAYFYQAADGQHMYLHPINAKCLAREYGSLGQSPNEITAKIVALEQYSMTEDLEGNYRYLSHLPVTCEFTLCELDLRPPVVSQDTLTAFRDELQKRCHKRQKKRREEKRLERKMEQKKRQPNLTPSLFPALPSSQEFTPEQLHDFLSLSSSPPLHSPAHHYQHKHQHLGPSPPWERVVTVGKGKGKGKEGEKQGACGGGGGGDQSLPSFAQALRGTPLHHPTWPTAKQPQEPVQVLLKPAAKQETSDDDDDGNHVPSYHEAFNEALLSASKAVLAAQMDPGGRPGGSRAAKKGRKKLVLFTTGGARGTG